METVVTVLAMRTAAILWAGTPIHWAETKALSACSVGASGCLIRSSWEILRPDSTHAGLDPALARGQEGDLSLVGRRFALLEEWDDFEGSEILMGNETGDQVLQELSSGTSRENRNPATSGRLEGNIGPWRAFARMEQVDHFSDATLVARSRILGSPDISDPSPWIRRAWFGENLPPFSLAGGGLGWRTDRHRVEASYLEGWIWQDLPLSDLLVGWEAKQARIHARSGDLRLEQTLRTLERMGPRGRIRTMSGQAAWRFRDSGQETGLDWRLEETEGPGGRENTVEAAPWIRHFLSIEGFAWTGFHRAGNAGFQFRDTLSRTGTRGPCDWRLAAAAEWTDRPDHLREEVESSLLDRDIEVSRALFHQYGLNARVGIPLGPTRLTLESNPWLARSPRAFVLDSATSQERFGNLRALEGTLTGWTQRLELGMSAMRWNASTGLRYNLQGGVPASRLDAQPPMWQAFAQGQSRSSTGLEGGARLAWRSRTRLRNLEDRPWSSPPTTSLDLWVLQSLGRTGLSCKAALLDLTASDRADLPRGGQRRPRLLVAVDWHPDR